MLWLAKERDTGVIMLALLAKEVANRISTFFAFIVVKATEVLAMNPVLIVIP